ncbi:multi-sensor hybrid histidine kinase : Chemotaxis protein methyltransferase CheR OS=Chondromyces apiculatus DSM 436 GN=CAP_7340 PE=4 SV=1: PAS_4: GAF_2: HisKA: HATPase_c: Response_reg [Gemmataceae bacterium]|nr:multi-sensor hybrid histidine kinase : Chemotaxis protein methyltransferase CheR OS=Chondromyces apiculatus DSM 436 GN=CAP_7340 PE=4 SV=1: PAS_4: GAF_2: HisKA: HATPase_c: Response_reg [Gemmataceae bacterium]VTT98761.1 multi-sensor hybrid histidine kinase : Chemotaxis protein methyltransferase CheR OS=Chondromyces apiculatus DSM 436 GN=CAP_7340 PE=4 SV=1: PAS_4: GAF_2: HisKA: HATPase_c: Response_reg [Gemmataceae bacterium]
MGLSRVLFGQLDAIGDWGLLATDADLTVTGWNRWLAVRSGVPAEAAVGRRLYDLFPDLEARGLDRYYRQALGGQTAILSQRLHKYVLPLPSPAADSGRMQQSVRVVPLVAGSVVEGTLTIVEDATERVAREADLQNRSRQQAALALSARSALAGHDIAAVCRDAVGHIAETVGADFAEALELQTDGTWAALAGTGWGPDAPEPGARGILDHDAEVVALGSGARADAELAARGVTSGLVVRIPGRGAKPFGLLAVYSRAARRFTPDEVQFARALADIVGTAAERKLLEGELRVRAEALAEADRRKDEFLAMLAHELRNPLAPVRNAVQVLRATRADDPAVVRHADLLTRQIGHMAHLVDDLLDVSRITRGKVDLRKVRVDLADLVAAAVETARPLIEARRHQLRVSLPAEPVLVEADPTRITQSLGNILTNAAKYTEDGGHIWVAAGRDGAEATVSVRDTGIGLSPEMLTRVFDLFTQESRTIDRSQGGLGIGLTLARRLVEMHGGTVRAASEGPGRGSEFTVRLPALPPGADRADRGARPEPAPTANRRLLIVDDNIDSAESMAELLALFGHNVRTAHDGRAALTAARDLRPEVILLDIGLPGLDGYEVARRIRQNPELHSTTLIAMTGYGQDEDRRKTREAGFDHHLVKPVDVDELCRILRSPPAR